MTGQSEIWQLDEHVRYRRLLDEAVVIHQDQAEALVLNETAISFLESCDGLRTTAEIVSDLTSQYDVEASVLAKDLEPLIEELSRGGIIHRVSDAGS